MDFAHTFSKNYRFFFVFFNKVYTFGFKAFFTTKDAKSFVKINFLVTFLSITLKNFEDNLRILANFGKFSRKNSKIYGFRPYVLKKLVFFFNKDYSFYTKNLFIRPKNCVQNFENNL